MPRFKNPYLQLIALNWHYAREKKAGFIGFYILSIIANAVTLVGNPYLLGQIFNVLQTAQGHNLLHEILFWMGIYSAIQLVFWALHGPSRVMERKIAFHSKQHFLNDMYARVNALPLQWHQAHHSGNTINRINKAAAALFDFGQTQFRYIMFIVGFGGALIALLIVDWRVGLATFLCGITMIAAIRYYDQIMIPLLRKENELDHHFASTFFDYVSNITTIISLRIGERTREVLMQKLAIIYPVFARGAVVNEWKWFVITVCRIIIDVGILLFYIWLIQRGESPLLVGSAVMVYQYLRRLTDMAVEFALSYEQIVRWHTNFEAVEFIEKEFDSLPAVQEFPELHGWQKMDIHIPRFKYEDREHHVHTLSDITLSLKRGQRVALVGASGAGKSTLLGLLRGIYAENSATIHIDNEQALPLAALSNMTTLIPQEPEIFENTIHYNITTGLEEAEGALDKAAHTACFDTVAKNLPEGIETDIREKGVNLSGGQKQRLALARGVFSVRRSTLLLLDEPTSSVDNTTERRIYRRLFGMFPNVTIISSIHRLHLLEQFDHIYVLEQGKIVEEGNFADLVEKKGGVLRKMWAHYRENQEGEEDI